jgi:hypothetical protein
MIDEGNQHRVTVKEFLAWCDKNGIDGLMFE